VIALSAPAIDTTTDAAQITVSGTITDAIVTDPQTLGVTIDCTGASVAKTVYLDANGYFETTVPLVEGVNKINVVAVDGAVTATSGNQAVTTRTVTRTVTPLTTYAIILVVVALILAAIAIFRKEMKK
jgi:subtilase family serine protease